MRMIKNKKGFELVWSSVVVMVLAFVVLLLLILFFTTTSGSFIGGIKSYFSYSNVDSVVPGCNILIQGGNDYSFCCEKKKVKYYSDGNKLEGQFTCSELIEQTFINGKINSVECNLEC